MKQLLVILASVAIVASADAINPKGIFVTPVPNNGSGGQLRPSVRYSVRLHENGQRRPVAASHRFQDRDRFEFVFELSQPAYVYLLHRQLAGNPDTLEQYAGSKGIIVVTNDDRNQDANLTLLYPKNGSTVHLNGRQPQTIPQEGYFQFDTRPGIEKIVMIVSPEALDASRYIRTRSAEPGAASSGLRPRNDSDDEVLGQLTNDLAAMESNTVTTNDFSSKGICVGDCAGYVAPRNPTKPFVVNIDLRHFPSK